MKTKKNILHLQDILHKMRRGQSGSAMVITALAMVVLLGFSALVLDMGSTYYEASKLQNALDSAALAGVKELPADSVSSSDWNAAKNQAVALAAANHIALASDEMEPIYQNGGSSGKIVGIKVTKSTDVQYSVARVLGINSGTVTRRAAAEVEPAGGITGAVPLCITADSLSAAISNHNVTNLLLKCTPKIEDISITSTGGWLGALDYGSGASDYTDTLAYGYDGELHVGDIVGMETGNMSGPTLTGFTTRYNMCTDGCTSTHYEPNCPRIVYVPVVTTDDPDLGNKQVKITSFAAFFLESVGTPSDPEIRATYLPEVVIPNTVGGTSSEDFGVYVSRLSD